METVCFSETLAALKMETVCFSETLASTDESTGRQDPEEEYHQQHDTPNEHYFVQISYPFFLPFSVSFVTF
jgi:hypothetical protein